jgi:hypothetical protein
MAKYVVTLCGLLACGSLWGNASWAEELLASPPHAVQSLEYGVALYESFQDQPVAALTQLMAADQRGRLSHQDVFAQLQLGNLSLSLGLTQQAEQIFSRLNHQKPMQQTVNFYLGKFYYYQQQPTLAQKWLSDLTDLTQPQQQERLYYLSSIAIQNKKLTEAQQYFDQFSVDKRAKDSIWQAYVSHNLALAYAQQEKFEKSHQLWNALYQKKSANHNKSEQGELALLQQRGRLSQGFVYLQQNKPDMAQTTLQSLPQDTPWLAGAILALSAATASEKNPEKNNEKKIEKAQQQLSWLQSLPGYVYEKSQGLQLAAQLAETRHPSLAWPVYQQALNAYQQQQAQLNKWLTIEFEPLYQQWINQKTPETLTSLLETDHQLIQSRQAHQQFTLLQGCLQKQAQRLPELQWMLAARQQAHQQRLNRVSLQSLQTRQQNLRIQFEQLEKSAFQVNQQPWLLASPNLLAQQQKWQGALGTWQNQQAQLPNAAALKTRLMRVQGALEWQLQEESHQQRWLVKNNRQQIQMALQNNQQQLENMQKKLAQVPDYALLSTRVINYQQKINHTQQQLEQIQHQVQQQTQQHLRQLLQQRLQVLQTHVADVQYQLARLSEAL